MLLLSSFLNMSLVCTLYSVLWATAEMLCSHPADLLRMGCSAHLLSMGKGRGVIPSEWNSLPPGAAWFCRSTTSSTSVKPKVISPPRAYRALHSSYSFGNWVEKMGDYQNRGRGLWVSGHVDIPLSWVSVTLTGRALACPLLWFNPQTTARPCVSPHSN